MDGEVVDGAEFPFRETLPVLTAGAGGATC